MSILINQLGNNIRGNNLCKMYHWSNAEVYSYQNFKTRHLELIINDKHISFYDLNKVFFTYTDLNKLFFT